MQCGWDTWSAEDKPAKQAKAIADLKAMKKAEPDKYKLLK